MRPSNGHIAVANRGEAAAWGQACSCWPIGDFNYLFFASSRLIYPLSGAQVEHEPEERVFERDLRINEGLNIGEFLLPPMNDPLTADRQDRVVKKNSGGGSRTLYVRVC